MGAQEQKAKRIVEILDERGYLLTTQEHCVVEVSVKAMDASLDKKKGVENAKLKLATILLVAIRQAEAEVWAGISADGRHGT